MCNLKEGTMNKYKYLILLTMLFLPVSSGAENLSSGWTTVEIEGMSQCNDSCNTLEGVEISSQEHSYDEWKSVIDGLDLQNCVSQLKDYNKDYNNDRLISPRSVWVELSDFLDRDAQKLEEDRAILESLSLLAKYEDSHNNKQKYSNLIELLIEENAEKIEKNKAARNKLNE